MNGSGDGAKPLLVFVGFNLVSFYRSNYLGYAGQDLSDAVKNGTRSTPESHLRAGFAC